MTYTITQSDIETGGISNTVIATAITPSSTVVSDVSDDPSTAEAEDQTQLILLRSPTINVTKSATVSDVNGNGINDTDDIVIYTIIVSNTGNIKLSSVSVSDTLQDSFFNDVTNQLNGPVFVSNSLGSNQGEIQVGEFATYTASVTVNNSMMATGFIANSVVATASSTAAIVSDTSDDPNSESKTIPPRHYLTSDPAVNITKTVTQTFENGDGFLSPGDVITYTSCSI